jgi:hypothetical protein
MPENSNQLSVEQACELVEPRVLRFVEIKKQSEYIGHLGQ